MYAFTFGREDKSVMVFRFEHPEQAVELLKNEPIELVNSADLFR